MISRWRLRPLIVGAFLLLGGEARSEEKWALLIGVDRPRVQVTNVTTLRYPSKDVDDLARVLIEKNGYLEDHVVKVTKYQAVRRDILTKLYDLADRIQPEDTFILYFSGHGLRSGRNNKTYWLTWDVDPAMIDIDGIRLEHLIEYTLDIRAKRKLILLDHCFAGDIDPVWAVANTASATPPAAVSQPPPTPATPPTTVARGPSSGDGPTVRKTAIPLDEFRAQVKPGPNASGIVVIPASRNEALEADTLQHGVFTWVLLRALTTRDADLLDPKGKLTLDELIAHMRKNVPIAAEKASGIMAAPEPMDSGTNMGAWVLADLPLQAAEAADQAVAFKETLRTWEAASFITYDTRIRCNEVIERWLTASRTGTPLTANDTRVWTYLKNAMESTRGEETRGKTLDEDVRGVPR